MAVRFTFDTAVLPGHEADYVGDFDRVLDESDVNARWQRVVGPLLESGVSPRTIVDHFEFGEGDLGWELLADD